MTSIWDKVKQRHATMKEIRRLQALAERGFAGHEPRIALLQDSLKKSFQNSPTEKSFVPYSSPQGSYSWDAADADRHRIEQETGIQVQKVIVPVISTGIVTGFNPFFCTADGIQLLARTMDDSGNVIESSDTARVFIRFNNPTGPWLPIGYSQAAQGAFKGDPTVYLGTIKKFWLYVQTVTQNTQHQAQIVLMLLKGVSIVTPAGGSNLFGSPLNPSAGAPVSTAPSATTSSPTQNPPSTGTGGTGGGVGDTRQCPLSGAPVRLYGDPELWEMRVTPCEDFIRITTASGREGTFSPLHRAYQRRGLLPLIEWRVGDWALTEDGEEQVTGLVRLHLPGATVDGYHAKSGHVYSAFGFIGHNVKL